MTKITESIDLTQVNLVNNNTLRLKFPSSVKMQNKAIAFASGSLYYSWPNVSSTYNNQFFQYIFTDGVTYNVTVPAGNYSITDLSNYLESVMTTNNHFMLDSLGDKVFFISWAPNLTYYTTTFVCTQVVVPSGGTNPNGLTVGLTPQLVISGNGFSTLLGVAAGTYPSVQSVPGPLYTFNGTLVPAISPVTVVNINCSWVNNNFNQNPRTFCQFQPATPFGTLLSIQTPFPIWYRITDSSYQTLDLFFTDTNNVPLPIQDTTSISVRVLISDID